MLASKEKLEDLRWRDELLSLLAVAVKNYGLTGEQRWKDLAKETGEESKKINDKLKTYDYAPKQLARQQHFTKGGSHDCALYESTTQATFVPLTVQTNNDTDTRKCENCGKTAIWHLGGIWSQNPGLCEICIANS